MDSGAPLRVLSLDGGGIRGISSLLILEDIMEKLRDALGLDSIPRPCDFFDLIGGTSTGGIIAIMLGRLGMTVDECIQAYKEVAQQAFTPKRTALVPRLPASPTGAFSAKALEAAIKKMLRKFCAESECAARRSQGLSTAETCLHSDVGYRDRSCTKTVVLAITKDNIDAGPTLFATYDTSSSFDGCAIWQVARATSAATTFFKPIKVGRDGIEFVDAGFGYNNPCEVLIEEARRQFPGRGRLRVLSIGTGLGDIVSIGDTRLSILKALKTMASSSKAAAARLDGQYGISGQYYRFNVDQGLRDVTLSDWDKSSTISAHTHNYLRERQRTIKKYADGLAGIIPNSGAPVGRTAPVTSSAVEGGEDGAREMTATVPHSVHGVGAQPGGASIDNPGMPRHYIPFSRNLRFVGRSETLVKLQQMLFTQKTCRKAAIVGLGGVGKTQVALQMAYWTKKHRPEYSIFWVSALSGATLEQAYAEMATMLALGNVGTDEDPKDSVRRYLSSEAAGPWLLVVDNADDMGTIFGPPGGPGGLKKYLPESEDGVVLFTTRSREVAVSAAGGDVVELLEMDPVEAADYLRKLLIRDDDVSTAELLKELAYLPLAITQAAAYMNTTGVPMVEYLGLLRGADQEAASLMSREFHDSTRYEGSQNAVATTWLVSFDQIRKSDSAAADLLAFVSCIEPKAIPQSMLPRPQLEEQMVHAIGTLCGYAFLTRRGDSKVFDMHSLVQLAARIWVQREGSVATTWEAATRQVAAVFPDDDYANRSLWREYLPHAFRVLRHGSEVNIEEKYDLCYWVGRCLQVDGRIREAVGYLEESWRWRKSHFEEDHPSRLASQHVLAGAYQANGQVPDAVALLKHVVAIKARTLAEDHPSRLASQHALAIAYHANGQVPDAVALLKQVVAIRERVLAEDHPDRLASQHVLAGAYQANGQVPDAVALLKHVVAIQARTLAEDHPDRLASQHVLAGAYQANGQVPDAVALLKHVVAIQARTLAEDHPDRLASQHELASAYHANGQVPDAVALLKQVVAIRERVLAEDHPDRLASQHALAIAYHANGQVPDAVALLKHVVAIKERVLAEDHPSRLASQHELASAYHANGQVPDAVALLKQVVAIKERVLAEDHPSRLASQHALAIAYHANGQVPDAVALLKQVVAIRERVLAEDHPSRLASQHALAIAYHANGQVPDAVALLKQVVAIRERVLAEDHPDRLASQHVLAGAYQANGQVPDAVALLKHVVAIRERVLAEDHPDWLASQQWLTSILQGASSG